MTYLILFILIYFWLDYIQPNPDLYGPFWISVTLIFAIAIFGNLATFFRNYAAEGSSQSIGDFGWGLFYLLISMRILCYYESRS